MFNQIKIVLCTLVLVVMSSTTFARLIEYQKEGTAEEISFSDKEGTGAILVKPKNFREGVTYSAIIWLGNREMQEEDLKQYEVGNAQLGVFLHSNIVTVYPKNAASVEDISNIINYLLDEEYILPERIFIGGIQKGAKLALESAEKLDVFNSVFALGLNSAEDVLPIIEGIESDVYFFEGEFGQIEVLNQLKSKFSNQEKFKFYEIKSAGKYDYLSTVLGKISGTLRKKKLPVKLNKDYIENSFDNNIKQEGFYAHHIFTTNNREFFGYQKLRKFSNKKLYAEFIFFSDDKSLLEGYLKRLELEISSEIEVNWDGTFIFTVNHLIPKVYQDGLLQSLINKYRADAFKNNVDLLTFQLAIK
ncbi:MAG: hypothetical protein HRU38_20075 [Saccharospirillaceae bacterium]|nr:hypothetical protein [Pseudomonadales bacterium]NRB80930.1 hypothetical protein [Saccharospirillaceae bacterium]